MILELIHLNVQFLCLAFEREKTENEPVSIIYDSSLDYRKVAAIAIGRE